MKRGIALVIGINNYEDPDINNLDKAVNDAKAITEKLNNLNFDVLPGYDISSSDFDKVEEQFLLKLPNYPLGIFYFAGHGCEIDRENFLVLKNAKVQNHANYTLKRDSVCLQDLIRKMCEKCDTNILIIDACRNTFKEKTRGDKGMSMSPVFIPKGTLIAFSTSPGETAGEGPKHIPNSNYTSALLHHMEEKDLEIERFFKKVRTTLHAQTNGTQTSWEHTSLIGNLILNYGDITSIDTITQKLPYSTSAIKDKEWNDPEIKHIIDGLKSYNYYTQNDAVGDLGSLQDLTSDQEFVIGRNILQAYVGGARKCVEIIENITKIARYSKPDGQNHFLNGILFEVYFDSNGVFRGPNLKSAKLDWLPNVIESKKFQKSIDFIHYALSPFSNQLVYIPSYSPSKVDIEIKGIKSDTDLCPVYMISNIEITGIQLLTDNLSDIHPKSILDSTFSSNSFKRDISKIYGVPEKYIQLNFIKEPKDVFEYSIGDYRLKIFHS